MRLHPDEARVVAAAFDVEVAGFGVRHRHALEVEIFGTGCSVRLNGVIGQDCLDRTLFQLQTGGECSGIPCFATL